MVTFVQHMLVQLDSTDHMASNIVNVHIHVLAANENQLVDQASLGGSKTGNHYKMYHSLWSISSKAMYRRPFCWPLRMTISMMKMMPTLGFKKLRKDFTLTCMQRSTRLLMTTSKYVHAWVWKTWASDERSYEILLVCDEVESPSSTKHSAVRVQDNDCRDW